MKLWLQILKNKFEKSCLYFNFLYISLSAEKWLALDPFENVQQFFSTDKNASIKMVDISNKKGLEYFEIFGI